MANIDKVLTADLASRGTPRLVMTTDKMKTLYLDDGEGNVRPITRRMYKWVDFGANNSTTAIGTLPANAMVLSSQFVVTTQFDAGTTNTVQVGVSGTANAVAASTSIHSVAGGTVNLTTGTATYSTSARDLILTYGQTGTAATAGRGCVVITYEILPSS